MKIITTTALALAAIVAIAGTDLADAARIGGGRSLGAQRQITPAPSTPKAAPTTPAPSQAVPGKAAPAPAAAGASRWLGPLAGLAAGIGLAALLSNFGLSESFGSLLLLGLLVVGGVFLVRMLFARRTASPMQYAGAGATASRVEPRLGAGTFEPVMGAAPELTAPAGRFPPGFDPAPFVEQAKIQFRKLQAAYDTGERTALADFMTPEMLAEVSRDIEQRGTHVPTEVMRLDAEILEVTTEGDRHWMSVRFTGLLREDGTVLPKEFDEIWNLAKPVDGSSGWLLAGIQQPHEMA
jgi:predicted lipid-binding transport protein (Tim44 family)